MGLAEEIARVRMKARGAEINARHRRGREAAQRVAAGMGAPASPDGVDPVFAKTLEDARKRAKTAADQKAAGSPRAPVDRIEQLVREGKLPPRTGDLGVGYEPTAEEILGELGADAAPPDGVEELPDVDAVLGEDPPARPESWGDPPAPAPGEPILGSPGGSAEAPPLAGRPPAVHSKRKRGR
jgi:hypothetical protein